MFKRDCYFIWLDGNNLAGRKPDKCRFHNVLACFAWLGSTALVLQVFEARKNPWIQRRTKFETEISVSLCNERVDIKIGYIFVILLCQFFFFLFFLAKTVVKMMRATIVFWINRLIKSHSRVKIIYTISYILSVYLKNMIEKNGKKTYINLEEAKNFELPTFFLLQLINSSWLISLKSNR